jgi:tetratricopeptide (TPR) repeat protein
MPEEHVEFEDVDERLNAIHQKTYDMVQNCQFRSATRLANEMRRLAKSEQRVIAYLHACFLLMNHAGDLLEPEQGRDRAIELISLLESEDRARTVEPDLPESEYADTVAWMTACAYDNLAKAIAQLKGFNSDGMHQCIGDGILVCHRTGKLQCITCFREYATDVYKAADDLDMAVHFARVGISQQHGPHDRRWVGARDLAQLLLLRGESEAAAETIKRAWELAETYHTPLSAKLRTRLIQSELTSLLGQNLDDGSDPGVEEPATGEYSWYELARDQAKAVGACCSGDYPKALELLEKWDRLLTQQSDLNEWFAHRLRLLAVHRLSGDDRQLKRLSEPLAEKARAARDWLTLRCLERILDPEVPPAPIPLVADLRTGLFAAKAKATTNSAPTANAEEASGVEQSTETIAARPEPTARIQQFWARIGQAYQEDESQQAQLFAAICRDVLSIDSTSVTNDDEARWLLHTIQQVLDDGARGREIWQWAESLTASRMNDATILSLLATLGASLRFGRNEELTTLIDTDRLEAMFRESLDLDANAPRNFSRAGTYFMFTENLGEAERCFARGSRLDRSDSNLALGLAEVYSRTDRMRDALAVLDMCVREGCEEPDVFWRAQLTAFQLGQYDAALAYLDRYEVLVPDQPWINYYRAASLLELEHSAEALNAAEELGRCNPDCPLATVTLQASALGALERIDEFRSKLTDVIRTRLAEVDYLSRRGLSHLFRRLWLSATCLPPNDSLRNQLEDHLLAVGLAPNELFDGPRQSLETMAGINFYEVSVQQPLDQRWSTSPACLAGEEDWQSYVVSWGVRARDERAPSGAPEARRQRVRRAAARHRGGLGPRVEFRPVQRCTADRAGAGDARVRPAPVGALSP